MTEQYFRNYASKTPSCIEWHVHTRIIDKRLALISAFQKAKNSTGNDRELWLEIRALIRAALEDQIENELPRRLSTAELLAIYNARNGQNVGAVKNDD